MKNEIICAGFGGQGVLTAGKILIYVGYKAGKQISWFPSYGNEMRGGSANCNVVLSDERIASPYADHPDIFISLNSLQIDRFMDTMPSGGMLFANSSLVEADKLYRDDIKVFKAPVTDIAISLKNERAANIVMLGYMCKMSNIFTKEQFIDSMCEYFESSGKGKFNEKNKEAFMAGYDYEA